MTIFVDVTSKDTISDLKTCFEAGHCSVLYSWAGSHSQAGARVAPWCLGLLGGGPCVSRLSVVTVNAPHSHPREKCGFEHTGHNFWGRIC